MIVTNCARCGMAIEGRTARILKEGMTDQRPLFHLMVKQRADRNRRLFSSQDWEYRSVILCEECQESLWRWIYDRQEEATCGE